jgi:hypothetical protein
MSLREIIYLDRDNEIVLSLSTNGVAINHSAITRCQIHVGDYIVDSLTKPALFDFTNIDKIILTLGSEPIEVGKYIAKLYIYDLDNIDGVAWGQLSVTVKY